MYESIVVGLDGREDAERILPHVSALARQFGSRVFLIRVTASQAEVFAATAEMDGNTVVDPAPLLAEEHDAVVAYLEAVAAPLRGEGIDVECEHVQGHASDVLVRRAAELGAGLIAVTTHAHAGIVKLFHGGSTAESVLHHAPCPVLALRIG